MSLIIAETREMSTDPVLFTSAAETGFSSAIFGAGEILQRSSHLLCIEERIGIGAAGEVPFVTVELPLVAITDSPTRPFVPIDSASGREARVERLATGAGGT